MSKIRNFFALFVLIVVVESVNAQPLIKHPLRHTIIRCGLPKLDDYHCHPADTIHPGQRKFVWNYSENYNKKGLNVSETVFSTMMNTWALLLIQNDSIVYERYWKRNDFNDIYNSFSMAKTVTAILLGIAIDQGKIKSVDDKVYHYLPHFSQGMDTLLTIRHLLTMTSGLNWTERFTDFNSDVALAFYSDTLEPLLESIHVVEQPGQKWKYQCGNTLLLGMIISKATGMSLAKYAEEELWQPLGASHYALWTKDSKGTTKAFCCFYATSRDFALLGRLLLNEGNWNGKQIIPRDYFRQMITPVGKAKFKDSDFVDFYGFQTWLYPERKEEKIFYFAGMYGQYIVVFPERNAILVRNGRMLNQLSIVRIPPDFPVYVNFALRILD